MRSQRACQFLVVLLLMLPAKIFSQQQIPRIGQNSPHTLNFLETFGEKKIEYSYTNYLFIDNKPLFSFIPSSAPCKTPGITQMVTANITVQNLPFFCRKEFQFEKTTAIPLRLRLGSLEYVNKLEGKK